MSSLSQLRAQISALEGFPNLVTGAVSEAASLGVICIDSCLPWGGLTAGGLHEISAENSAAPGAAIGFATFCLGRLALNRPGPILWVSLSDELYPPGLAGRVLPTARLLLVRPARSAELLWSLEQILRCKAVAAVLGDVHGLDFRAARRLSLASRASGVPALLFNRGADAAVSLTRWRVAAAPSDSKVGVGAWRWRLTLVRCRGIAMGADDQAPQWLVEMKDATGGFSLVAQAFDRSFTEAGQRCAG